MRNGVITATAVVFAVSGVLVGGTGVAPAEKSCGLEFTFTYEGASGYAF